MNDVMTPTLWLNRISEVFVTTQTVISTSTEMNGLESSR